MDTEEFDPKEVVRVVIGNGCAGPRYVNTVDGAVVIPAGARSGELEMRLGEIADLEEGLEPIDPDDDAEETEEPADPADPADAGKDAAAGEGEGKENEPDPIPEDLASSTSNDGIVPHKDLDKVADDEGIELKSDDSKAEKVAKIVAHREAKAAE